MGLMALMALPAASLALDKHQLRVDFNAQPKPQTRFWQSTGMSPAEMLLTRDMQLTLRMIGDSNGPAIRYLRPHYLLDLVDLEMTGDGGLAPDWRRLDQALDPVHESGLLLIFELMGNPSGMFDDFRDSKQVWAWRHFVEALAKHLMARYGREAVEQWYFETTNEPDIHPFWPQPQSAFLNYYDASSEGLKAANPNLKFGGPGVGRFMSPTLKALLEHCDDGTNFLTGERGVRLDFISFHSKALPQQMVRFEQHVVEYIRRYHPRLKDVPLMNNEADPIGGWGIPYWWREGPWHAAFVMQSIDLHNRVMVDKLGANLIIAAGDNAFQGGWHKRALLARFLPGDNDAEQWGSSDPGGWKPWDQVNDARPVTERFLLIKKPAFTAMSLAALLGDRRHPVDGFPPLEERVDHYRSDAAHLGCIATRRGDGAIVLICYNAPAMNLAATNDGDGSAPAPSQLRVVEQSAAELSMAVDGLDFTEAQMTRIRIDAERGNPVEAWRGMGSPEDLTAGQFNRLQRAQEPAVVDSKAIQVREGSLEVGWQMAAPSVEAVILTPAGARLPPPAVTQVSEASHAGLEGERVSYVRWSREGGGPIVLYEVDYAEPGDAAFRRVSAEGLLDRHFALADARPGGRLRILARNLFGDAGEAVELRLD